MDNSLYCVLYITIWIIFNILSVLLILKSFQARHSLKFKSRGISLLFISGISIVLVTNLQFSIILTNQVPCHLILFGTHVMVSAVHFPYILRGLRHSILIDAELRARWSQFSKWRNLRYLLITHFLLGIVFSVLGHSEKFLDMKNQGCHLGILCGVYIVLNLLVFVSISIWNVHKMRNFEDVNNLSRELRRVHSIWIILGVPYIGLQFLKRDQKEAAHFLVAMHCLLLHTSFFTPLKTTQVYASNNGYLPDSLDSSSYGDDKSAKAASAPFKDLSQKLNVSVSHKLNVSVSHDQSHSHESDESKKSIPVLDNAMSHSLSHSPQSSVLIRPYVLSHLTGSYRSSGRRSCTTERLNNIRDHLSKKNSSCTDLIESSDTYSLVLEMCKKSFCEENPMFLSAVIDYKKRFPFDGPVEPVYEHFYHIYCTFISRTAVLEVNISSTAKKGIEQYQQNKEQFYLLSSKGQQNVFENAYNQIDHVLKQNLMSSVG